MRTPQWRHRSRQRGEEGGWWAAFRNIKVRQDIWEWEIQCKDDKWRCCADSQQPLLQRERKPSAPGQPETSAAPAPVQVPVQVPVPVSAAGSQLISATTTLHGAIHLNQSPYLGSEPRWRLLLRSILQDRLLWLGSTSSVPSVPMTAIYSWAELSSGHFKYLSWKTFSASDDKLIEPL